MRCLPILIGALWLVHSPTLLRAADPEPTHFARVEIRGTLGPRTGAGKHTYQVTVNQGKLTQNLHLDFAGDPANTKSAKEWEGSDVEVTGDLQVDLLWDGKKSWGTAVVLKVKTFKKTAVEKPKKDGDAGKLIGTWMWVGGDQYGKAMVEKHYENFGLAIDANDWTYLNEGKKGLLHHYRIDPEARPKTIDLDTVNTRALFHYQGLY